MKPIYWIALGLALALTVSICDGRKIYDKASIAAGKYEEAIAQAKTLNAEKDKAIAEQVKIIALKDRLISDSVGEITVINTAIGAKDKTITDLKAALHNLEAAGDLSGQVANLKEQIAAWSEKFTLAESVIAEKDKIIIAWAAKFNAQLEISDSWKAKYDAEYHLRTLAEEGWWTANRKLKARSVMGNIKSGLIIAAVGYWGYSALKGK